ncbi:MAG TPA: FtsQ-type POTRA domain-containing protein [Candidatus Krumholzibacteria bacterium]|nr:FtsQ-type POTRA domain-containing protein [Candidatus Krumholzibacteria bacterium]
MGIVDTTREHKAEIRARARRVMAVFIVGVLIVSSLYIYNYATTSDRFAIKRVELAGLSRIPEADVTRLVSDLEGTNILLAPLDEVEARLEAHPRISHAVARRVLPNRITWTVTEREPVALVFTDRYFEIDASGMVMPGDAYTALLDLPTITGVPAADVRPGVVCANPMVTGALEALDVCRSWGGEFAQDISELRATNTGLSIRSLREDCVLLVGDVDFEKRLRKFFLLREELSQRESPSRLIDLRFDNQVVLRSGI